MKQLNSILIEGEVREVTEDRTNSEPVCLLDLAHDTDPEKPFVSVRIVGRLAENAIEYIRPGRQVRIVGRLAMGNAGLHVEAEHVEYRPFKASRVA